MQLQRRTVGAAFKPLSLDALAVGIRLRLIDNNSMIQIPNSLCHISNE